jgi:hypothetical protein
MRNWISPGCVTLLGFVSADIGHIQAVPGQPVILPTGSPPPLAHSRRSLG